MRQSNIIFATLIFTFIIYITVRGQLPRYLGLFKGGQAASTTQTKSDHVGNAIESAQQVGKVVGTLAKVASFFGL